MKTTFAVTLCVLLLLVSACASKVNDPADVQAIKDLLVSLNKAYAAGDADAVVSTYYTDNAVRMLSNLPALMGKDAIRDNWRLKFDLYSVVWEDAVEDARVIGDWAVVRGSGTGISTYKATGMSRTTKSKWIAIYERQANGGWKCVSDCVNSDLPLPDVLPLGQEEIALQKIEQEWAVASVNNDLAAFDNILAAEYANNVDGVITPKKQFLANMKSGVLKIASAEAGEMKVLVLGETGIVHGLWTEKSTLNGKDMSGTYRYTDVFAKRDGRWQCVAGYSSKLR